MVLDIHEDARFLEHETIVKSYTQREIGNAFDCTNDDRAFGKSDSSNSNNSNFERQSSDEDFRCLFYTTLPFC